MTSTHSSVCWYKFSFTVYRNSLQFHNRKNSITIFSPPDIFWSRSVFMDDMFCWNSNNIIKVLTKTSSALRTAPVVGQHLYRQTHLVNVTSSPYTESRQELQRYVHCKLREFCKKASILKGCGTKKNTVRRVVCKDEPIKDERPRNYCKIDALHSHHSASVTSLFFVFFWFDWRKEEQNVRFYKKKQKKKASTAYTPVAYHHLSRKKKHNKKKILFRRELFWTLELSSFLHSGAR